MMKYPKPTNMGLQSPGNKVIGYDYDGTVLVIGIVEEVSKGGRICIHDLMYLDVPQIVKIKYYLFNDDHEEEYVMIMYSNFLHQLTDKEYDVFKQRYKVLVENKQ